MITCEDNLIMAEFLTCVVIHFGSDRYIFEDWEFMLQGILHFLKQLNVIDFT